VYGEVVGRGHYSDARVLRRASDGLELVVKQVRPYPQDSSYAARMAVAVKREITVLKRMNHPNVISLYGHFVEDGLTRIVTRPYASRGSLESCLREERVRGTTLAPAVVLTWARQLTSGLAFVHAAGVLHRDIKTANIFITREKNAVIGDFGSSTTIARAAHVLHDGGSEECMGTPYYQSPELILAHPSGPKSDVWALGVVLYELCALERPFAAADIEELRRCILQDEPAPLPATLTRVVVDCTMAMLVKEPSKRISAKAASRMLHAPHDAVRAVAHSSPRKRVAARRRDPRLMNDDRAAEALALLQLGDAASSRGVSPMSRRSSLSPDPRAKRAGSPQRADYDTVARMGRDAELWANLGPGHGFSPQLARNILGASLSPRSRARHAHLAGSSRAKHSPRGKSPAESRSIPLPLGRRPSISWLLARFATAHTGKRSNAKKGVVMVSAQHSSKPPLRRS